MELGSIIYIIYLSIYFICMGGGTGAVGGQQAAGLGH